MDGIKVRLAMVGLLGALALGTIGTPMARAGRTACGVRNVTQGTAGRSFARMVSAADDADRLTVWGTCFSRNVVIRHDLTILGVGDRRAVLDARGLGRVLTIRRSAAVTLRHLAITRGDTSDDGSGTGWRGSGGGILLLGALDLVDSVLRGNRARFSGGGIERFTMGHEVGGLTITDSVVRGNHAGEFGGGISGNGDTTLTRTVVRDNRAAGSGGGGINTWGGSVHLIATLVNGNTARYGGGIRLEPGVVMLDLTDGSRVTHNVARLHGGGIWSHDGPDTLVTLDETSTVTGNTPDDCPGTPAC